MSEIKTPFPYFGDPNKSRALFNAQLYFGVPDTDPTIASNQKLVKAIQEDGTEVTLSQPVSTNSGGYPTYNGSPVRLSISGNFSFKAFNAKGTLVLEASEVENVEPGSEGFSGVVAKETQTLVAGQTTVVLNDLGANESVFYIIPVAGDRGVLAKDIDYTITNSTTIELAQSYNAGSTILARQNDPTGQLVPINNAEFMVILDSVAEATAAAISGSIDDGDTIFLRGYGFAYDGQAAFYRVTSTGTPDGVNVIVMPASGLNLELIVSYHRFKNYAETAATASLNAGTISINLDQGTNQTVTLTENVTGITLFGVNPNSSYTTTYTLRMIQDGTGGRTVTWPGTIIWPGGSAPTVTSTANAIDVFGFTTYDAGSTWYGFTLGQGMA